MAQPSADVDLEDLVSAVWAEVLGSDDFGPTDRFFDVGGDSLLLATVRSRLRELRPDLTFSTLDLFRYPTVESLAEYLRGWAPRSEVEVAP